MLILKSINFSDDTDLVNFINDNNISKENILTIIRGKTRVTDKSEFTLFFYGESETKEKTKGFWG